MTKIKNKKIEEQYKKLTHREHILQRSDTYIGSIKTENIETFTVDDFSDLNNLKIVKKAIEYNAGFIKIFDEVITNASDHSIRTGKVKAIKVDIVGDEISVWNDGAGIPIELHKIEKVYVPELIFGHLLTGENFDDTEERIVGGRNGLGVKLCNIYSKKFTIETADGKHYYKQTFVDNLSTDKKGRLPKPSIRKNSKNFTKVTFRPDYERFGLTTLTDDLKSVIVKRTIDIAAYNPSVKVYFNGMIIPIRNFKDYIKLYTSDEHEIIYEKINDRWEVAVVKSDFDGFEQASMVNGIATIQGGSHVNCVINSITNRLKTSLSRGTKYNINPNDIKSKIFLFVNSKIVNPEFSAQTKEFLKTKVSQFANEAETTDSFIKKISKSEITKEIIEYIELKEQLALKKSVNGNPKRTKIRKLDDANKAGTRESAKCSLYLAEGDSALATCLRGFSITGRNYYGAFPLKGKPLNVRGTALKKIMDNEEIKAIISALGLEFGKKYKDTSELRYGKVVIMSDMDVDGIHIKGLLINLFEVFWPELLKLDFIYEFVTPIVKATKGSIVKYFYKLSEYKKWKETTNTNPYFIKYYKGLGTIEPKESKEFFKDIDKHLIKFNYRDSEKTHDLIDMVFNDKRADERKEWLLGYTPNNEIDKFGKKTFYDSFINEEMIEFSMADNIRSIPSAIDGLKPTQRKILYTLFKNNYKNEVKVNILSGSIIATSAYHQGPVSLDQTIVGMAQDFVGSNNINLLMPAGEFGTRSKGGKDASASRYIFSNLMPIAKYIFNQEDNPVLTYMYDDGVQIEPSMYVPVIPMVLINGADGIGTGWSTKVPMYNVEDIIDYIEKRLNGTQPRKNIIPFYNGFKGTIVADGDKYVTTGVFERSDVDRIRVTELPIGMWNDNFIDLLDKILKEEDLITDYTKNSTDNNVDVTISIPRVKLNGMSDEDIINKFKLTSNLNMTNMKLFDVNGKIKSYSDIYEIIEDHLATRLDYYVKRKSHILWKITKDIEMMENRIKFIELVVNDKLPINKRTKEQIVVDIEKNKLALIDDNYDYLLNMPIYSLSKEKIQDLKDRLVERKQQYKDVDAKSNRDMWKDDLSVLKREYKKMCETEKKVKSKKQKDE